MRAKPETGSRSSAWRPRPRRAALGILAVAGCLLAQQPAAPPPAAAPSNGTAMFRASARLVIEAVSVKDKNGNAIKGLTAKDFTVTEDGQPQTISFCEFQTMDETPEPELSRRPEAAPAAPPAPAAVASVTQTDIAPELPGDIHYKNRRLIVLYFDMGAMPIQDQVRAQSAAEKFITRQMTPSDLVAIMSFSDGVRVKQDFTDDREKLLSVINQMFIGEAQGFDETADDSSAADYGTAFGEDDSEFNLFNTDRQLAALQTAVNKLGRLNEKKVLVYFASNLNLNGLDNQAQFAATTNAAIKANVAFWTVDSRGLVAQAPMGDATRGSPGGIGMYSGASAMAFASNFQRSQDTMYSLASDTGGKALLDTNDLSQGIVNAEKSISSYYIIGYYSANENLDGKFRRIKVTYNGDSSAKVDYRQGYWADKQFSKFTQADKERQLQDALMLQDPITEITIATEVDFFQLNSAEYFVPVMMKIPGSELAIAKRGGAEHTVIDFIGEVKDDYNVTIANVRDKVDVKLTGETAQQLQHQPIQYGTAFTILPGTYTLKVLARDDETGRIGTYWTKFVVPNLDKEQQRIHISSVILSGQRQDMRDALFSAKDKDKGGPVNPLIADGQELVPSVTRVFSKSRDMFVLLQAYREGATAERPLIA
ncbi:MAG TPA: VWA domain-containing protein, partial [Bryobacteraceae bacterium]|nr:VWA domain-containing protein [Bryobacteraceae bacterium]